MSGGPTVTAGGHVVGINVARRLGAELESFLVPARFAVALIDRAAHVEVLTPANARAEIGRQLADWQRDLYRTIDERDFRSPALGPHSAPHIFAPWRSVSTR